MEKKIGDSDSNRKHYGIALFWWLTVSVVAILVVAAGVFTIFINFHHHSHSSQPSNIVPKYASSLQLALQFFDIQKCNVYNFHNMKITYSLYGNRLTLFLVIKILTLVILIRNK
jgi:ABC-type multidrug transport system permease subunit